MIWIVIGVVLISLIVFGAKFNADEEDLKGVTLSTKFKIITEILNNEAFDGEGKIYELHKRSFNLGAKGHNQLINFEYAGGDLTITWKYKYFQKEVVNKKLFPKVRNLSVFEQQAIADAMIASMSNTVEKHQNEVLPDLIVDLDDLEFERVNGITIVFYKEDNTFFTGKGTDYYANGQIKEEMSFKEGKAHGFTRNWFENGVLANEYPFRNGLENGVHKSWYDNGKRKSERMYNDGVGGEGARWLKN